MGFYDLRCVFGVHAYTENVLDKGLSATHISFDFGVLHFDEIKQYSNVPGTPGCAFGLFVRSFRSVAVIENPLIAGFVEYQHGKKSPAWRGKTTVDLASPSDCHKTAKIMSDETP
jgi:hypothetical protein